MIKKSVYLPLLVSLTLGVSACKDEEKVEGKEAVTESAKAADIKLEPGRWEISETVDKFEMPKIPPQQLDALKQKLGTSMNDVVCLRQSDIDNMDANFFSKSKTGCKSESFAITGGVIAGKITCEQNGIKIALELDGTYSADNYSIVSKMHMMGGRAGSMMVESTARARRTGECNGTENAAAAAPAPAAVK